MIKGCDLSHWNADVDFKQMMRDGVRFAYLKALEGIHSKDNLFSFRAGVCQVLGLPFGAYHFFRPRADALEQAAAFCEIVGKPTAGNLPPALDLEYCPEGDGDQWDSIGPLTAEDNVRIWLSEVEKRLGVKAVIYTSASFWRTYLGNSKAFADHPLWAAHYDSTPPEPFGGWQVVTIWQQMPANGLDTDVLCDDNLAKILVGG